MKTTKTRVKQLCGVWVAEICDDETGEVLIVGIGSTEEAARLDARENWRKTVSQLST